MEIRGVPQLCGDAIAQVAEFRQRFLERRAGLLGQLPDLLPLGQVPRLQQRVVDLVGVGELDAFVALALQAETETIQDRAGVRFPFDPRLNDLRDSARGFRCVQQNLVELAEFQVAQRLLQPQELPAALDHVTASAERRQCSLGPDALAGVLLRHIGGGLPVGLRRHGAEPLVQLVVHPEEFRCPADGLRFPLRFGLGAAQQKQRERNNGELFHRPIVKRKALS